MVSNTAETHSPGQSKVFYGYWIIAATFLFVFIMSGCGFYAFSLFVKPLETDLGWSRAGIMAAFSFFYLIVGVASPMVGRLVDRYSAKPVIVAGAVTSVAGFVLLSLMRELWQFYLIYTIMGTGMAAIGYVPASAVVSNWFKKRRGMAIGIMSIGVGGGGAAMAPLIGGFLIPRFGWSGAYLALAAIIAVLIIPPALLVLKTKPSELGLYPDGMEAAEAAIYAGASPPASSESTLKMAIAAPVFWLIAIPFLTSAFSQVGTIMNQVPYLEDIGFPVATAAAALGAVGLGSAIGKFGFGWLCDRMAAKYACAIGLGLQAASIIVLMNVSVASPVTLVWLYAIMMGLGAGSWLPTMSMLASGSFGMSSYGAIFGAIVLLQSIGLAAGPFTAGYIYDVAGSYRWAFIVFLVLYAVAIPVILAVRRSRPVGGLENDVLAASR